MKIIKYLLEILKKILNIVIKYRVHIFDYATKIIFIIFVLVILTNIVKYSYKAWLYPIRTSQYYDECSYISMGKYFRTISPLEIFKDHILKNKPIPNLYNEFNCRLLYWPILLSFPLKETEDRIKLHDFRAKFMVIGTILFFLIGLKLSGITGGVISSALWIGTPLLNYWGHFFMTENPSFIFLIAGYLFLLYSDKFGLSSIIGGIFLGIAGLTRFTTMPFIFVAPFFIIAVFFHPLKRKNYQIISELSKTFTGIVIAMLPYFIFTWWMYKNPFVPFLSAKYAVNNFPVNDPVYYINNLWIEFGPLANFGIILGVFAPILLAITVVIKRVNKEIKNNSLKEIKLEKKSIFLVIKEKLCIVKYISAFNGTIIYYAIIISSLILTDIIYIYYISTIVHKLPRYLMGALIPLIIIISTGFGAIEPLLINILRLLGNTVASLKKIDIKKLLLLFTCLMSFIITLVITLILPYCIWNQVMNRPFNNQYIIPDEVKIELKKRDDITSLLRLRPEYLSWESSIKERLKYIETNPEKGIDDTTYYGEYYWNLIKIINKTLKADEVFYIDIHDHTPYTPSYIEVPCIFIESTYNKTINQLIAKKELIYNGYVLVNNDTNKDIKKDNGKYYVRSLNKISIIDSKKFKFIKTIGNKRLYYFKGKPFPYKYGTRERISRLYKKDLKIPETESDEKKEKSTLNKLIDTFKKMYKAATNINR